MPKLTAAPAPMLKVTHAPTPTPTISLDPKPKPRLIVSPALQALCEEYEQVAAKASQYELKKKQLQEQLKGWNERKGAHLETADFTLTETLGTSRQLDPLLLLQQGVTLLQITAATKEKAYTYPRVVRKKVVL